MVEANGMVALEGLELTHESRQLVRQERHKIIVQRYRRELRMKDLARPETDFDTAKRGEALLEFAEQYRKTHKKATLSEIADKFLELEKIFNSTNGKVL